MECRRIDYADCGVLIDIGNLSSQIHTFVYRSIDVRASTILPYDIRHGLDFKTHDP